MNYKTKWFSSKKLQAIARRFDVNIDLRDPASNGKRCGGAWGANIERKLDEFSTRYGGHIDMRDVRQLLAQGDWSR